jgi:hypothetical protein
MMGAEARVLGHGGVAAVARAAGVSRVTVQVYHAVVTRHQPIKTSVCAGQRQHSPDRVPIICGSPVRVRATAGGVLAYAKPRNSARCSRNHW